MSDTVVVVAVANSPSTGMGSNRHAGFAWTTDLTLLLDLELTFIVVSYVH